MQEHVQRFDELKNLQQQDSEKIKVLYELMLQAQNGSLNQIESAVLEQKIELAAIEIGEQDSDRAKALKAIADKQKKEADALLEKIARQEHDLAETYKLHALNEYRNGYYAEAVKWYQKILELQPDNFEALLALLSSLNRADRKKEARELSLKTLISSTLLKFLTDVQTYDLLNKLILTYDYTSEAALAEPYLDKALELVMPV